MEGTSVVSVPLGEIFEDWNDDERMRALFTEFRPKNVNPEGWTTKMKIWTDSVNSWCKKSRTCVINMDSLRTAFERKGLFPQCLPLVLQQMSREGVLSCYDHLDTRPEAQGWIGWGVDTLVKKPVAWSWTTLTNLISGQDQELPTQKYVHMPTLKDTSQSLLEMLQSNTEPDTCTISLSDCQKIFRGISSQQDALRLILNYLQKQQKIITFMDTGLQYIKLLSEEKETTVVTEADVGILRLQKTLVKVQEEIEKLRDDIQRCTEQAKVAMKNGQKTKVQQLLRSRKYLELSVDKKSKTADQLEVMIHKLKNSSTDQQVFGALSAGLQAQKAIFGSGKGIEQVENTMADIQDAFDEQEEIAEAIGRPVSGFSMDDTALEEELDELLNLQESEDLRGGTVNIPASPIAFTLPEVPNSSPSPKASEQRRDFVPEI